MGKFVIPLIIILVILGALLFLGSEDTSKKDSVDNSDMTTEGEAIPFVGDLYTLSKEDSEIKWEGRKTLIANYVDSGTLGFAEGQFYVEEGQFNGGRALFDMTSIKVVSTGLLKNEEGLDKHLKSDDWFTVEKYPTAELLIRNVDKLSGENQFNLSGELIIKDISQGVSFPATVVVDNGTLTLVGETELDRTLWDLRFGSDKFFDNLADNVIDDFFTVKFNVKAESSATVGQ